MKSFKELSVQENISMLKLPVYLCLLAANGDGILDEAEKKTALEFTHIKTISAEPLLARYYLEVDKVFEKNLIQLDGQLPREKTSRDAAIKKELLNLDKIKLKLGKKYTSILDQNMNLFINQVIKSHHNLFVDFIFPLPIPGLTE